MAKEHKQIKIIKPVRGEDVYAYFECPECGRYFRQSGAHIGMYRTCHCAHIGFWVEIENLTGYVRVTVHAKDAYGRQGIVEIDKVEIDES